MVASTVISSRKSAVRYFSYQYFNGECMEFKDRFIRHALICFGIILGLTALVVFSPSVRLGFFGFVAFLLAGTVFTTIGVSVGDAFRRFVMPDAYFVSGAVDSFKKKVFWSIGPQAIGWFVGFIATNGFMTNVLGYPPLL